jgi:hypothetical protein
MESMQECLLKYRLRLRQLLYEAGVMSNPGVMDDWILDRLAEVMRDPLKGRTYVLEYSPNCPSPYMVRLVGREMERIDKLPVWESRDAIGYGQSFREAATAALKAQAEQNAQKK